MNFHKRVILIISGIILALSMLEIGLRIGGFVFYFCQEYRNKAASNKRGTYRIICLGESTTAAGESPYPGQLEEILNQSNIGLRFSVLNKGVIAINSSYILQQLEANLRQYKPQMVIAMMGMNDKYIKYYEGIGAADSLLFNKFKVYKLVRLIGKTLWGRLRGQISDNCPPEKNHSGLGVPFDKVVSQGSQPPQTNPNFFSEENSLGKSPLFKTGNFEEFMERGKLFRERKRYSQAVKMFESAIKLDPLSPEAYIALGWSYQFQENYPRAEEMFKKAIGLSPENLDAYLGLGTCYRNEVKYALAQEMFKKITQLSPKSYEARLGLGRAYLYQGKRLQAAEELKKAIEINPEIDSAYIELGICYRDLKQYARAEEMFKKAIEINPREGKAHLELGWIYQYEGKISEAEEFFKKAIELDPGNDKAYAGLAILYRGLKQQETSDWYYKKANQIRLENYSLLTVRNYQRIKEFLDRKGVKLVCVQYPMRSIEPLKRIFEGQSGVIFVDNERIFKEAVKRDRFKAYFMDMFGGDFGHCTRKGNRLLAENIVNTILREYFHK